MLLAAMGRDDEEADGAAPTARDAPRWNAPTVAPARRRPSTASMPARTDKPATESRFALGEELGRGGMGAVVAATDTLLEREVAIKQALADDAEALRMFEREAKITAQLEHPSIVPVHDAGFDAKGRPYYIMRRLEGRPLADAIADAPDIKARLAFVPNVLAAVDAAAFAHARGVIHRDIKPWNILLGDYGETLLIDWGLARHLDEKDPDSLEGKVVGTPGYMAPEQVRGDKTDARADVYALGATLLHVLLGKSALQTTPTVWMEEVAAGGEAPLDRLDREVPVELGAIIGKAMAARASDRYRDGVEMAADLRAFLAGQLVAAHRYTTRERIARFVRKHRVAVAAVSAALIIIVVGGVLAIRKVVKERDLAEHAQRVAEHERKLAAERAELMLVDRASALAVTDPTHAVALLRTLPVTSPNLARARDIAAKAAANGVAHALLLHAQRITFLELSADATQLLSGSDDGTMKITNLATRTSRILASGKPVLDGAWVDGGKSVVYVTQPSGLYVIDVSTGHTRALDEAATPLKMWLVGSGDRVRTFDLDRRLVVDYPIAEGAPSTIIAHDVERVSDVGDDMLIVGGNALRFFDGHSERVVGQLGSRSYAIALSADAKRGALATGDTIIEWDLVANRELRRWPLAGGINMFYAGDRLMLSNNTRQGSLDMMATGGPRLEAEGDWTAVWHTAAGPGTVIVNSSGVIRLFDGRALYAVGDVGHRTRAVAGRPDRNTVVVGSEDGWIRWFDMSANVPGIIDTMTSSMPCAADGERLYISTIETSTITVLPLRGGKSVSWPVVGFSCPGGHAGSRVLVFERPGLYHVLNGATGKIENIESTLVFLDESSIYFVQGDRTVRELLPTGETPVRWLAAGKMSDFAAAGAWFAAVIGDEVSLFDTTTQRTVSFALPGPATALLVTREGKLWVAIGTTLYRSDGNSLVRMVKLPAEINQLALLPHHAGLIAVSEQGMWRVGESGSIEAAFPVADVRAIGGDRVIVTIDEPGTISTTYLDTGERVKHSTFGVSSVMLAEHLVVVGNATTPPRFEVYIDPVPGDPTKLHAWIDSATNAVVDSSSDVLRWR